MMTLEGFFHAGRPLPQDSDEPVDNASGIDAEGGAARHEEHDDNCYRLTSIVAADAPDGCTGGDWFIYRITQGGNAITGYRCGSVERVSADVESIVTSLNDRRNWPRVKQVSDRQRRATAAARRAAK
jgi:hypothetical protein